MITVLAANDFGDTLGDGVAGPIGLLIIVLLVVALVFLMKSMNRHLRRVRDSFPYQDGGSPSAGPAKDGHAPDAPAGEKLDRSDAPPGT